MRVLLFALAFLGASAHEDHHENFGWEELAVRLPKGLSDHTADLDPASGSIFIAGGCDSPNGNEFSGESFFCATISDSLYVFFPQDGTFGTQESLPRPRYRHCAEVINGQLWLLGGRDLDDGLLSDVDVYDIATESWSTFTLPDGYLTSDHACFTDTTSSFLYVTGGYNAEYTALNTTFRIDTSAATTTLAVEDMAPLGEGRGDIYAASDGSFAYVGGGFTDANGFCAPLASGEKYEFATNTWTDLPEIVNERGEIVMVEVDGHLFAMGGERQIEGICDVTGTAEPGELTVGTELVEVLEDGEWDVLENFEDHKFRFAAVAVDGSIYTFGGQSAWDGACNCFKTTDGIHIFGATEALGTADATRLNIWATVAMIVVAGLM